MIKNLCVFASLRLCARASDGREFFYRCQEFDEREYLCRMESPNAPLEIASFVPGRKSIGYRMHAMNIGGREQFKAYYNLPPGKKEERDWAKKPYHKPFYIDRINFVEEPVGPNGEMVITARFAYATDYTEVRDAENLMIRYRHDGERLNQIEYYDEKDQLSSIQKFYWDGSRLRCKALLDAQGTPLFAKTFSYDGIGNVVEEGLWGDLSGSGGPLILDEKGNPTGEGCRKWYSYLAHFNVPILEREEDGLTYKYEYLQGTNLLSAKFTCDGESIESWEYRTSALISHTDPRGLRTTFCYDSAGRKIEERAEGRVTAYKYDALGFLERTYNGITAHVEIHDVCGRIVEQWDEDSTGRAENWMAFAYDGQNLKKEARRRTSQGKARDVFVHDPAQRLIRHTDPEGNETCWIYDETFQNDLGQRVLQKAI